MLDVTTFTAAELEFLFAAIIDGHAADFDADSIRPDVFDAIVDFLSTTGQL